MQANFMGVIFTNHAIERLYGRGIAQSDAWYTVKHPDGSLKGQTPDSWRFYKDKNGQRIEVIAKLNNKNEWVVLSCWSKMLGNNQAIFPVHESLLEKLIKKMLENLEKRLFKKQRPLG